MSVDPRSVDPQNIFDGEDRIYYMLPGVSRDKNGGWEEYHGQAKALRHPGEVAIIEKRPEYPPMQLVFRGATHFEAWLACGLDNDGVWVGHSPEASRERGKRFLESLKRETS